MTDDLSNDSIESVSSYFDTIDWYSGSQTYRGYGRAVFEDPAGVVEGPVTLRVSDTGVPEAELDIHALSATDPLPLGVMQLLHRDQVVQDGSSISMSITEDTVNNRCTEFVAEFTEGIFVSTEAYSISHNTRWSVGEPLRESIKFRMYGGYFTPADMTQERSPKYWVVPLVNMIAWFPEGTPGFEDHPLRLRKEKAPIEGKDETDSMLLVLNSHKAHPLIQFEIGGRHGFIEPIIRYDEIKRQLQSGTLQRAVTALMVGEVPNGVASWNEMEHLLPRDLQIVLGVATGAEVGSPWIELRDRGGNLICRYFSPRGNPIYARGHVSVADVGNEGVGQLLTSAFGAHDFGSSRFRFLGSSVLRAGLHSMTIEERLSIIFRALDGLCKSLSVDARISADELLDDELRKTLVTSLGEAAKQIRAVARALPDDSSPSTRQAVNKVIQNVEQAKYVNSGFGKALRALIVLYGLHDLEVVDSYMLANSLGDKKKWEDFVAYCRGIVMHSGYIDHTQHPVLATEAPVLLDHLHDILLRIFLKMAGYQGSYQATTATLLGTWDLDWVRPDTPPKRLGYR